MHTGQSPEKSPADEKSSLLLNHCEGFMGGPVDMGLPCQIQFQKRRKYICAGMHHYSGKSGFMISVV